MTTIHECSLEYCINNQLDSWSWCQMLLVRDGFPQQADVLTLQFWESEENDDKSDKDKVTRQCSVVSVTNEDFDDTEWNLATSETHPHPYENVIPDEFSTFLFEVNFSTKCCVVGMRSPVHFMKNSLLCEPPEDCFFLVNEDFIVNLRGDQCLELVQVILSKRYVFKCFIP